MFLLVYGYMYIDCLCKSFIEAGLAQKAFCFSEFSEVSCQDVSRSHAVLYLFVARPPSASQSAAFPDALGDPASA